MSLVVVMKSGTLLESGECAIGGDQIPGEITRRPSWLEEAASPYTHRWPSFRRGDAFDAATAV
ncbi:hypothetical protein CVT26_015682 [Gymnopilus dilepis]|uniref:Uncharacterized protein n=1 Tax=Gymnopilus dilepis TaxID=231916 RepID=A0A409VFE2_9AGAR|nr:hypothetical protein CVT26_015682 [Gymnopilus dilepis]